MPAPAAAEAPAAIRCRGLVKRYGELTAVDGLDLEVRPGECFGLLGPNGAGKTTTVEILEGLLAPDGGTVELFGLRWASDAERLRRRLGVVLQETQLPDKLTVAEVTALFASFYPAARPVDEVLATLSLGEKRNARLVTLSGGQRRRVAIACALVGRPDLLFLDEPTTGLDPQSRRQVWELVAAFRAAGGTIVLTTHYMDEAERLCDRISVVDRGRVIAAGSPAELIAQLGGAHVVRFTAAGPVDDAVLPELAALAGVHTALRDGAALVLHVGEPHLAIPALLTHLASRRLALTHLETHHASLEDVFVHLTGRHLRDE